MHTPPSPLETLRQLKEMLDAGTITPAEFEALKQKLVFPDTVPGATTAGPAAASPSSVELPAAAPQLPLPPSQPFGDDALGSMGPAPIPVPEVLAEPQNLAYPEPEEEAEPDEMAGFEPAPKRNPLNIILSIGGLLALLGLVLYLSVTRRPSEHLTSGSQTAADSVATTVETGPQAEQIELPVAEPETVRLAPAHPPVAAPAPTPAEQPRDSAATVIPSAAADSVAN